MATFTKILEDTSVVVATWDGLGNAENGAAADMGSVADKTVTVTGTFGGATVTIQGSNDKTNWFTMNDFLGTDATFVAAGMMLLMENPRYIRAITAGGAGSDIDVKLSASLR